MELADTLQMDGTEMHEQPPEQVQAPPAASTMDADDPADLFAPRTTTAPARRRRRTASAASSDVTAGAAAGRPRNKWGLRGIRHDGNKKRRPWEAKMSVGGKDRSLGYYRTNELAAKAYDLSTLRMRGTAAIDKLNLPQDAVVNAAIQLVLQGRMNEVAVPASATHALEVGRVAPILVDELFDLDSDDVEGSGVGALYDGAARERRAAPRRNAPHAGAKRDRGHASSAYAATSAGDVTTSIAAELLMPTVAAELHGSTVATSVPAAMQAYSSYAPGSSTAFSMLPSKQPRMSAAEAAHALLHVGGDSLPGAAARSSAPYSMFNPSHASSSSMATSLLSPLAHHALPADTPTSAGTAAAVAGAAAAAAAMAASMSSNRSYAPLGSSLMDPATSARVAAGPFHYVPQFHAGFALVGYNGAPARTQM